VRGTVHLPGQSKPLAVDVEVRDAVVARAEDGAEWSLPLSELTLEPGGFEADFVFCRPPDRSFTLAINDPAFVPAIEERADERLRGELAKVAGHRREHHVWRWIGIGSIAAVVAVVVLVVLLVPRMLAASVDALPTTVDEQLGDAASAQVETSGEPVEAPVVTGFVEQVVERLEPQAADDYDFRVRVVESEQVNAFALPGGRIVVFTGLIRAADSPEQVAGVLAHEMSHVTLRHGLRNVAHEAGLFLALQLLLGDASGWVELAADAALVAQSNDYSREQEAAADAEGVRMMMAAGLDPEGLADFFRLLEDQPGSELAGPMSWLSTHPDHESRIAHVHELSRELPAAPRRPLAVDWDAVKRAVGPE
jgi:Zn-dependent protease with chaperone function